MMRSSRADRPPFFSGGAKSATLRIVSDAVRDAEVHVPLTGTGIAPDIVAAILAGTQPVELTAEKLVKRTDLPLDWAQQKELLGFD